MSKNKVSPTRRYKLKEHHLLTLALHQLGVEGRSIARVLRIHQNTVYRTINLLNEDYMTEEITLPDTIIQRSKEIITSGEVKILDVDIENRDPEEVFKLDIFSQVLWQEQKQLWLEEQWSWARKTTIAIDKGEDSLAEQEVEE